MNEEIKKSNDMIKGLSSLFIGSALLGMSAIFVRYSDSSPSFLSSAPVKEPFSCPKSSLSNSSDGIAGQFTDISGFLFRLLVSCMNFAFKFPN